MINVTKPFLPPIEEYYTLLEQIWERCWLTNNGPVLLELEDKIKEHLDVENFLFLGNGTIALQMAIKALGIKGEIITTPFSYVATTSSIVWEGCKPVFVDIDEHSFNIDVTKIEAAINEDTTAIMATHVFGNACDIDAIQEIAEKHGLAVIYDAAHCFGTRYKGKSIFGYGDVSTASFHATKIFSTVEGGGIFSASSQLNTKMSYLRNFGHDGPLKFEGVGINGKNSEFHAAMGLVNLRYIDDILEVRKTQWKFYRNMLADLPLQFLRITERSDFNYSYFPIVFESEEILKKVEKALIDQEVYARRYFNPSLNTLDYVEGQACPVSESVSVRVLTLPLYHTLGMDSIEMICGIISKQL